MIKVPRSSKKYNQTLATYLRTKEGTCFALDILSQLIDGFELDAKGKIVAVQVDDSQPIQLNLE